MNLALIILGLLRKAIGKVAKAADETTVAADETQKLKAYIAKLEKERAWRRDCQRFYQRPAKVD